MAAKPRSLLYGILSVVVNVYWLLVAASMVYFYARESLYVVVVMASCRR